MSKDRKNKSRSTKKYYRYTAHEVANLAGVSEGYVRKIRARIVEAKSDKAQKVLAIDDILYDGSTKLLNEVERILR